MKEFSLLPVPITYIGEQNCPFEYVLFVEKISELKDFEHHLPSKVKLCLVSNKGKRYYMNFVQERIEGIVKNGLKK